MGSKFSTGGANMRDLFQPEPSCASRKELRPHQIRALDLLRKSMAQGNRRVVICAATGFGKTLTGARIIEGALAKGNRVIFTAPAISLIDQTVEAFEGEGIRDIGVMQANHPRTDKLAKVQVASVQTLARRDIPEAALVIVDECHIRAEVIERLMAERPDVFFVGLSATPGARGMGRHWQDLVVPCSIADLIEGGYLSRFTVYAPDVPDLSGVKTQGGDYAEAGLAEVMGDNHLIGSVVETWLARGENRPTLLFGVNRAHASALQAEFQRAGIAAGYCDAFTDSVERKVLERRFRSGEVKIACSVRTLTTGVDWPVSCIIDAAPTKSEMLHVQKIGRGLRVNPGTEDLIVLDHAGNTLRLGLVTDIAFHKLDTSAPGEKQERKGKAEKLPKACPACSCLITGLLCPFCGHERQPVAGVETGEGELVEVTGKRKPATSEEKQAWWSGIKSIQRERGRSDGWASHTYRDRFGVWPRGLDSRPGPATPEIRNFIKSKDIRFAKSREARV